MKKLLFLLIFLLSLYLLSCKEGKATTNPPIDKSAIELENKKDNEVDSDLVSNRLLDRINEPASHRRTSLKESSFGTYLRSLELKPEGSEVKYYDGTTKTNHGVYVGVMDLEIGDKDLHQCADAVMRLRAEYLWNNKFYERIHFNFTNGHKVEYSEWMQGKRMNIEGNNTYWVQKTNASNSYEDFWNYLELIFMYAGTASLEKEMKPINASEAEIGDVLIQGGFPGHAVIIIDEVEHQKTGEKMFLLAQSYMPAQELQVLTNPNNQQNPWYTFTEEDIETPEWSFKASDLKRFTN